MLLYFTKSTKKSELAMPLPSFGSTANILIFKKHYFLALGFQVLFFGAYSPQFISKVPPLNERYLYKPKF